MLAAIFGLLLAIPMTDDPAEAERARHGGTWAVTGMVRGGTEASDETLATIRRIVQGDHVVWTRDGKNFAGTRFEADPSKSPAAIDLIPDGGPARDRRILGIYKFEGDTLTICVADLGEPRPTAFEAGPGSKQTLQRFVRAKAAAPKPKSHD